MKILSIRLKNINSLRGEHLIDFGKSPLSETGLFAITGPTGAGKTSILDALTLALYGLVPRYNRDSPVQVMSYHTGDCYAEVEFEVEERVYRSRWSLARARNKVDGNLQDPKMELHDLTADRILEEKKTAVVQLITEITGLDYFRFLRSVLLAQGDFAAFLKADEKSRGELLEKITGTDLYTRLSRKAFEKQKEHRQLLEKLQSQMDTSQLLTAEELEVKQTQLRELETQIGQVSGQMEQLGREWQWLENLVHLRKKSEELHAFLGEALQEKQSYREDFQRYEKHLKALPFQADYKEITLLQEQQNRLSHQLQQLQTDIVVLDTEKNRLAERAAVTRQGLTNAKKEQSERQPMIQRAEMLMKERDDLRDQFRKIREDLERVQTEMENRQSEINQLSTSRLQLAQRQEELRSYLQKHAQDECLGSDLPLWGQLFNQLTALNQEVALKRSKIESLRQTGENLQLEREKHQAAAEKYRLHVRWLESQIEEISLGMRLALSDLSPDALEDKLNLLQRQYPIRFNQLSSAKEYTIRVGQIENLQQELLENEKLTSELLAERAALQERENQVAHELNLLQRLVEAESLIQNYENVRLTLVSGEPCPLCGATHHPYREDHFIPQLSKTQQDRDTVQQELDTVRDQLDYVKSQLKVLEASRSSDQHRVQNLSLEVTNLEKNFVSFSRQLGEEHSVVDPDILQQLLNAHLNEQQRLLQLQKEYRDKNNHLTQYKEGREKDRAALQVVQSEIGQVKVMQANLQDEITAIERETRRMEESIAQQRHALESKFQPYGLSMPDDEPAQTWLEKLRSRARQFRQFKEESETIRMDISRMEAALQQANALIEQFSLQAARRQEERNELTEKGKTLTDEVNLLLNGRNPIQEKERLSHEVLSLEMRLEDCLRQLTSHQERLSLKQGQAQEQAASLMANQEALGQRTSHLLKNLQRAGFGDIGVYQSCLLDADREARYRSLKEAIEEKITRINGAIVQNDRDLKTETERQVTLASLEEVGGQLQSSRTLQHTLLEQAAELRHILGENDRLQQKYARISTELEKQQREFLRWKTLSDMIGSANGAEFPTFAQGLTLAHLVQLANRHLHQLNPRYHIRRVPGTDLDLEIIDRDQADNIRPVKTLSGGETFLVSLALALGLSDLAGSKTRIDSLFIDEGFGTLDPQTLDTVVATLENLQATGKMIGIISHIELLKERITSQIQVIRLGGGVSTIKILG